jgi:hypothetical protein
VADWSGYWIFHQPSAITSLNIRLLSRSHSYLTLQGISLHMPKSNKQWLIAFAVQLIPGGMLSIGSLFIKESPRWRECPGPSWHSRLLLDPDIVISSFFRQSHRVARTNLHSVTSPTYAISQWMHNTCKTSTRTSSWPSTPTERGRVWGSSPQS